MKACALLRLCSFYAVLDANMIDTNKSNMTGFFLQAPQSSRQSRHVQGGNVSGTSEAIRKEANHATHKQLWPTSTNTTGGF